MKLILNQDVYNLGEEGDVCTVKDGYARNFLIPQKLAVPYNNMNVALFKSKANAIAKRKEEKRKAALSLRDLLKTIELTIKVSAGDSGKLFGAVTASTIVEALAKEGVHIEKKKLEVPSHTIKMTGTYSVVVRLYENETAMLKVHVVNEKALKKQEEAAANAAAAEEAAAAKAEDDIKEADDAFDIDVDNEDDETEE